MRAEKPWTVYRPSPRILLTLRPDFLGLRKEVLRQHLEGLLPPER